MWIAGTVQGFAQAQVTNTLPFVRTSLRLSEGEMSQVLAITRLGAFLALAATVYGDRRGRRWPFLLGFTVLMAANGATAFAGGAGSFTLLQLLVRFGTTAVGVLAIVLLSEQLSPAVRAYGISIYGASGSFGAGLALMVLPIAGTGTAAWRYLFAASFLGLILLPFLRRQVRESPLFDGLAPRAGLFAVMRAGTRTSFALLGAASFLAAAYSSVAISFTFERLVNDLGFSTGRSVVISLVGGTLGGVGFFLGGRMADEWGRRPATAIGFLLAAVGGVGLYTLEHPLLLVLAVVVSTFGSFAAIPAVGAHRNELFPTGLRATAVMWLNNLGVLGSAAGLASGRWSIDRLGLSSTVTFLAAAMALAALLTMLLPETRGQRLREASSNSWG